MAFPSPTVFFQGLGVTNADELNAFVSTVSTVADLKAAGAALNGMVVTLQGFTSPGDGGTGLFWYNVNSTAADDGGVTAIQPNGVATGRWLRLPAANLNNPPITGPLLQIVASSTTDLGSVNSHFIQITGTASITSFGSSATTTAPIYFIQFGGGQTLVDGAALQLPGGANITTATNDFAIAEYLGSGNWIVLLYNVFAQGSGTFASIPQTLAGTSASLAVTPAGLAAVAQSDAMIYAADTSGSANSITLALTPTLTNYVVGMEVAFLLANTVTGATTININGLGSIPVTIAGSAVTASALKANQIYEVRYDGTNFELMSVTGTGYFESAEFASTASSNGTVATGFPVAPKEIQAFIRCKTNQNQFVVGDEVIVSGAYTLNAWISGTNIKYQVAVTGIALYDASGNDFFINTSDWKIFLRARL